MESVLMMSAQGVLIAFPTELSGMEVQVHVPDMCCRLFHIASEHADWEKLKTEVLFFAPCTNALSLSMKEI